MLPDPSSELALQVLRLEQRLDSYQRLHQEELDDLRRAVAEVKDQLLIFASSHRGPAAQEALNLKADGDESGDPMNAADAI